MDELVAWLREQIAHARKLAQDCLDDVGHHVAGEQYDDGSGVAERDAYPSYPWGSGAAELAYMAATQPRYMLNQCEAHNESIKFAVGMASPKVLELLPDLPDDLVELVPQSVAAVQVGASHLLACVALAYQHCEGYREEWRP